MRSCSHVLRFGVFTALFLSQVCSGIKWLAISHAPASLHVNQTQHCKLLPGLVSSQAQLCRSNLEIMQTIIQAAREVKKTCQKTFADMRWNCSSIEIPPDAPKYRPDLDRGTREAAFVYALSAATISHTIARACTSGDLRLCSCGPIPAEIPEPGYRWGGCADNLHYGLVMGSKFSDAPMKMKKPGSHANKLMHLALSLFGWWRIAAAGPVVVASCLYGATIISCAPRALSLLTVALILPAALCCPGASHVTMAMGCERQRETSGRLMSLFRVYNGPSGLSQPLQQVKSRRDPLSLLTPVPQMTRQALGDTACSSRMLCCL